VDLFRFQCRDHPGEIPGKPQGFSPGKGHPAPGCLIIGLVLEEDLYQLFRRVGFPDDAPCQGMAGLALVTVAAMDTRVREKQSLSEVILGFGIMAPGTRQGTALEKNRGPDAWPVNKRSPGNIKDQWFRSFYDAVMIDGLTAP